MSSTHLRAELDRLDADLRALHTAAGDRALNASEQASWDQIEAERAEVRDALAAAEEADRLAAVVTASRARWGSLKVGSVTGSTGSTYSPQDVSRMAGAEVRSAALHVLDGARHLAPHQGDYVDALIRSTDRDTDGAKIAQLILLTETDAYRSAFQQVLLDPHPVLSAEEARAVRAVREFRAASLSDASGGYGVPALVDPSVILTDQQSGNPLWRLATVKTITVDTWRGVSSAGVTWSWDSEGAEVSDDAPTLAQPSIPTFTARGFVPYSIEIGQDYANFSREMSTLLAEGYSELTAAALITGPGSTAPTGIVTALEANTNVHVLPTTDGAFAYEDVHKLWSALPDRAKGSATWLGNPDTFSYLATYGDTYGSRTASLDGVPVQLRGRPIAESSYVGAFSGTTGAAQILIVGDFRRFVIVQRAGMTVEAIPHLFSKDNGRPTGQRGLFAWARVGADSVDDDAFRTLRNA